MPNHTLTPNRTKTVLPGRKMAAARLVAEDTLTDVEIALEIGISKRTLEAWKLEPDVRDKVVDIRREMELELLRRCRYASPIMRALAIAHEIEMIDAVFDERAVDVRIVAEPGGPTGRVAIQDKIIGVGPNQERITSSEIDTRAIALKDQLLASLAKHLGQWTEKRSVTFDLRKEAERLAAELGISVEQVMNEAGLLEAGAE